MPDRPINVNKNIIQKVKEQQTFHIFNLMDAKAVKYNLDYNEEQVDLKHRLF